MSHHNRKPMLFLEYLGIIDKKITKKVWPLRTQLIDKVRERFFWSDKIEVSFEMNPEDVTEKYIKDLYDIGINRISLGGQSFQDSILNELGRMHSKNELREAIKIIKN